MSYLEFKVVDESHVRTNHSSYQKYEEIHKALESLPEGKWLEITVPEGERCTVIALSLQQSSRVTKKSYKIKTRTYSPLNQLWITKVMRDAE